MPSTRDRTQEFFATVNAYQSCTFTYTDTIELPSTPSKPTPNVPQSRNVHQLALQINANIHRISQTKLPQIQKLAKSSDNLRDYQSELNSLVVDVQQDLQQIHAMMCDLRSMTERFEYQDNQHYATHHRVLLDELSKRYEQLKTSHASTHDLVITVLNRQKKQRERLGVVKRTQWGLNRRDKYKSRGVVGNGNSGGIQTQTLRQDTLQIHENNSYRQVEYNQARAEQARDIESQLREVSGMMTELAEIVGLHRDMVDRIDNNVIKINEDMNGAILELQRYLAGMSANRTLMLKVFALIIFFAIFFVVFVA